METFNIVGLTLSGLVLLYATSMRLFKPRKVNFLQTYLSNPANNLEPDTDLLNETRGVGAVMFLGGITLLLGAILPEFRATSFVVAIVIFGGVAVGRLLSIVSDGRPSNAIFTGLVVEFTFSLLNIVCLVINLS